MAEYGISGRVFYKRWRCSPRRWSSPGAPVFERRELAHVHRHETEAAPPHGHDRPHGGQHQVPHAHLAQHRQQPLWRTPALMSMLFHLRSGLGPG